jgi:hypothetical protein
MSDFGHRIRLRSDPIGARECALFAEHGFDE